MVFITEEKALAIDNLVKEMIAIGSSMTRSEIAEKVKTSAEVQGLSFDHVYSAIELKDQKTLAEYLSDFQSYYVANTREKLSLTMVSPYGKIDSKSVLDKQSVSSFPKLDLSETENGVPVGDSLDLLNNNKHIAEVIEKLAGKMPAPKAVTIVPPTPVSALPLSGTTVGPGGTVRTNGDEAIDESLTETKEQPPMDDKDLELSDEEIKKNAENEKRILDEIAAMSVEEMLSDDIDMNDLFKGCSL
jgi:hypothetical protein